MILNAGRDEFGILDIDLVRVDLPAGGSLAHLNLVSYSGNSLSFMGFQAGSTMTFDPLENDFACIDECLGYALFGGNEVATDLVPLLNSFAMDTGSSGFSLPLIAPQYTFWVQDTSEAETFQFDFVVSLPGDYNGDHFVNAADYTVWRNTLGQSVTAGEGADGDFDEIVGPNDYVVWKTYYGQSAVGFGGSGAAAEFGNTVPEPASAILVLTACVAGALFFRRDRTI
jgi:hypothetical protein